MTNEERIKSMSQDELVEFIDVLFTIGRFCQRFPPYCHEPCRSGSCYSCVYNWLKEEVADEKANEPSILEELRGFCGDDSPCSE